MRFLRSLRRGFRMLLITSRRGPMLEQLLTDHALRFRVASACIRVCCRFS
jgi:hypothetical protein